MKTKTKNIIFTKAGKVNQNLLNALSNCRFNPTTNQIYTGYYNGSGRWATRQSAEHHVIGLLNSQCYKFTKGNDAPNGGITGDYLKVSKTAFEFIQSIKSL